MHLNPHQIEAAVLAFGSRLSRLEVQSLEGEDTLLLAAVTDDHEPRDATASREIDRQKDALLDEISRRPQQKTECKMLFTFRWRVV